MIQKGNDTQVAATVVAIDGPQEHTRTNLQSRCVYEIQAIFVMIYLECAYNWIATVLNDGLHHS